MDFHLDIDTVVSLIASGGTIAAITVSAIKYFRYKNAETARASENLYLELKDTLRSLDEEFSEDVYHTSIKDHAGSYRTVYFTARSLNHDFYDSLVYSGRINFLDPSLQQRVQDSFKLIKAHNKYVDMVFEMVERSDRGVVPSEAHKYCEWMDDIEKRLQRGLPKILVLTSAL